MTNTWITDYNWAETDPAPDPANGTEILPNSNLMLSWDNQIPAAQGGSVSVDVYCGMNPTVTSNPVVFSQDVTGQTRSSVNVNASTSGTYYWRIVSDYGVASVLESDVFTFVVPNVKYFDNEQGSNLWSDPINWNTDALPTSPDNAYISDNTVLVNSAISSSPVGIWLADATLSLISGGSLAADSLMDWDGRVIWNQTGGQFSMSDAHIGVNSEDVNADIILEGSGDWNFSSNIELGTSLVSSISLTLKGSQAGINYTGVSGSDTFVLGSAATIETRPDAGGSSPLELGAAKLILESGSQWILDGRDYTGSYTVGERFYLANYGSFTSQSGDTRGIRYRNFALPTDRDLQLVNTGGLATAGSLYYEVIAQTPATGPNIIVINLDDVSGGNYFGFEGRKCLTPTIDSLASNGINFTNAFCASTVCAPSRYALLTGRYASRNTSEAFLASWPPSEVPRFTTTNVELETDGQNIGAWLQQAGYRTGFVGKSHNLDSSLDAVGNWASLGMVAYGQTTNPANDPAVNGAMKHNYRVLCQRMRTYGFDFVGGFYFANLLELRNDYLNVHNQEWVTKNALDFIDENHNQPFFLYVAPTMIHGPLRNDLSPSLRANPAYTSAGYLPNEDYSFMPSRQSIINEVNGAGISDLTTARVTWIDYSIQAILNKLDQYGLRNDTLIVFTADQGWQTILGNPVVKGKTSLYEAGMKIPLILYCPDRITSPGRTYTDLVQSIDLVPTFLELAGATEIPGRPIDGKSLVPVLNGSNAALHDDVYCEIGYARGVRTLDWKYIELRYTPEAYDQIQSGYLWYNSSTGAFWPRPYYVDNSSLGEEARSTHPGVYFDDNQLFNLNTDPSEQTNLFGQYPVLEFNLKKSLESYAKLFTQPILHLDAAESGATVLTDGSNVVTQWADQSGSGNDAIPNIGSVYYPGSSLSASGLQGLDFGVARNSLELFNAAESVSWLDQSAGTNGFAVMIAFKCDALGSGYSDLLGNSSSGSGFGIRYSSTGQIQSYLDGQVVQSGPNLIQAGDTVVVGFNYDAMQGQGELWDSKNDDSRYGTFGAISRSDFSEATGVTVGSMTNSSQYLIGMVAEIIVYDKTLRPAEFRAEREALYDKWTDHHPEDIDDTGDVGLIDFQIFVQHWLKDSQIGNFDQTGLVDLSDAARFASKWLRQE
jgi:arylsulfatase A-like enzyme